MEWMILPLKRYAEFSGRSRRLEFWMFALLNIIVTFVILSIMMAGGISLAQLTSDDSAAAAFNPLFWLGFGLIFVWVLGTIIPNIAVTIRRLHDRDMSGWWYLGFIVASIIPFVNLLASIAFLVLMLLPGTRGPNRYGEDPKAPAGTGVFA